MTVGSSQAFVGMGTKFQRWDTSSSPGAWQEIAEVFSISGPAMSRETINVTHFGSSAKYRERISGLRDGGTVSLSMNFRRDVYDILKADFEDDDRQSYRIILPDDDETTFEFLGLVTELPPSIPAEDRVTMDVSIEISGEVTVEDWSSNL